MNVTKKVEEKFRPDIYVMNNCCTCNRFLMTSGGNAHAHENEPAAPPVITSARGPTSEYGGPSFDAQRENNSKEQK